VCVCVCVYVFVSAPKPPHATPAERLRPYASAVLSVLMQTKPRACCCRNKKFVSSKGEH
jgi:hypothetical protein